MRKLLSIGALAAGTLFMAWQPVIAEQQASVIPAAYYHHGRYYPYHYHGRYYTHRNWHRSYWYRGRYYPGYYRYY